MGAWGEGLLDNDAAGDLEVFWKEYILPLRQQDPGIWTADRLAAFFRYFRALPRRLATEDADAAAETLALGAVFQREGLAVPKPMKLLLEEAASLELRPDRLAAWTKPAGRKRAIDALLTATRGRPPKAPAKAAATAPPTLEAEVRQMAKFAKHFPQWIQVLKGSPSDEYDAAAPDWMDRIFELVDPGLRSGATPATRQRAIKYRLMCMSLYLGCMLDLRPSEILRLIEKAEATEGDLPFAVIE